MVNVDYVRAMWQTRLLILGLVRWLQPVHGYQVQRELLSWRVQDWAQIKGGSIYHALKKLTQDGCLEIVGTAQVDNRPTRTSYRITAAGEDEFHSTLREKLWSVDAQDANFWIAWSFVNVLSHHEAAAMLRHRATVLSQILEKLQSWIDDSNPTDPTSANFLPMHVKRAQMLRCDVLFAGIAWCEETAKEAETGRLYPVHDDDLQAPTAHHWKTHIDSLDSDGNHRA